MMNNGTLQRILSHRSRGLSIRRHTINILFLMPVFLFFTYVVMIPFFQGIPYSLTNWKSVMSTNRPFVGLANYGKLLKNKDFLNSFVHTLEFSGIYIIGANFLGLIFALILYKGNIFNNIIRTLIFIPFTVSMVASTKVWNYVFTDIYAPIMSAITGSIVVNPLGSSSQVITGLAVIEIWRDMGYCMLIYIAALQAIPIDYYEAANLEGASKFQSFIHITCPLIVPAFTANITLLVSWGLKVFDTPMAVYNMAKFSRSTAMYVYELIFANNLAGVGQAGAILLTGILLIVTNTITFVLRKKEVEM